MSEGSEGSARRVHAVLAAAMAEPSLLNEWQGKPQTFARKAADAATLDLRKVQLFAGLTIKVRHNDVRLKLPLTFKLLDMLKLSIEIFSQYADAATTLRRAGKNEVRDKIQSFSCFLEEWLDGESSEHLLVRDIIRHECAMYDLGSRVTNAGRLAESSSADNSKAASRPLRSTQVIHHEMSCNPSELAHILSSGQATLATLVRGEFFYVYIWDHTATLVSLMEVDQLGFVLLDLANGRRSVERMAFLLRRAGVSIQTKHLQSMIQALIDRKMLTLNSRVRV